MRPAIPVTLSGFARRQLERIRRASRNRRVWTRATIVLMSARQMLATAIAKALGISLNTVTNCRKRWRRRGLAGLADRPHPGRPPEADTHYIRLLLKTVRQSPQKHGYVFTVWSVGRLGAHLEKVTDVRMGPERLRQILHAHDIVYRRPRHTLHGKRNEGEYRRAKKALQRLKRGLYAPIPDSNSGFPTRSSFTCSRT